MRKESLDSMVKGWFVGDFSPAVITTKGFEVAVKRYAAGDCEDWHYHKVATEVTVVVSGKVKMVEQVFGPGDIITLEPGEGTSFEAITDAVCTVVKVPSLTNDKFTRE